MKTLPTAAKRGIYIILLLIQSFIVTAQNNEENSETIINKGTDLYTEKNYDGAIAEFKKVHRNDSNYFVASIKLLATYLSSSKDSMGLIYCDHLLKLKNDYTPSILIFKGSFLGNLNRYPEAEAVYIQAQKDYPLNNLFPYEMGMLKLRQKKPAEAYDWFVKSAKLNPLHALSHFQLGSLAYRQNNITASMLALQFYFVCDNQSKRAQGLVIDLEKMSKLELEVDSAISIPQFENENDFTEMESIIKSKVALSEKYKSKTDLNFDLTKQMQLVVENIGKYKEVKGFYNDFYGKFFSELYAKKHFEPYVYFSLSGMKIERVDKWVEKNKADAEKFYNWAYSYICENMAVFNEDLNGKTQSVPHWYVDNKILAAGVRNAKAMNEGYWNYYYTNGIKKSEGEFKNGIRNGAWKYYFKNGGIREEIVYDKGVETVNKAYYANTSPKYEFNLVNNKIEGKINFYYANGNVKITREYKDGKINGKETQLYRNGNKNFEINNYDNIYEGDLVGYFDNGKTHIKYKLVKNKREGPSQEFYNNDNNSIYSEGNYLNGEYNGEWKYYFKNGKLSAQGSFNEDGRKTGEWKGYYDTGVLSEVEFFDGGKLTGLQKYYDQDGILWQEFNYKKGKMQEYRAFKKDGSQICNYKVNGKNFSAILYHPNGIKKREGMVSDGELEGVWKDYSNFGVLTTESNYKEGSLNGRYVKYHANGKILYECTYDRGTQNGYYKGYFITGDLESEGMIEQGERVGNWIYYKKNKKIDRKYYYEAGEVEGWVEFNDVNGKLTREELYSESCLIKVVYHDTSGNVMQNIDLVRGTGVLDKKSKSGQIIFHKEFLKDYIVGDAKDYYVDGTLRYAVKYVNGKREGKGITYDELGRKKDEADYFNDEIDGKKIVYYANGKTDADYSLDNGDYHGKAFLYHANGKIYKELNYSYGDLQGESLVYDESGELICKRNFDKDFLVNYTYKDAKGGFVKPMELPVGDYTAVCYFQNGKKSMETAYTNGELNGKRIVYFSNGKPFNEDNFYHGVSVGDSKEYYINGNLKFKESHVNGELHGKCEYFYENGKPECVVDYMNGQKHGWTIYYDEAGKILKSILYYNNESILVK